MKGIESKSLPRRGGQGRSVEQAARPGAAVGRCAWSVLYLLDLLPWMRDVHPWFTRGRAWRTRSFRIIVIIWCVSLSARSVNLLVGHDDTFDSQKGVLAKR
jgi:hypothetical protein